MEQRVLKGTDQEWLDQTYEKLLAKMKAECARVGTDIPYIPGEDGKYRDITETKWGRTQDGGSTLSNWTNGFWPGMLWQMYHATGDEAYKTAAVGCWRPVSLPPGITLTADSSAPGPAPGTARSRICWAAAMSVAGPLSTV